MVQVVQILPHGRQGHGYPHNLHILQNLRYWSLGSTRSQGIHSHSSDVVLCCQSISSHGIDHAKSILPKVMACCLLAPSHYLDQCQFIHQGWWGWGWVGGGGGCGWVWGVFHSIHLKGILQVLEITLLILQPQLPRASELKIVSCIMYCQTSNIMCT